EGRVVVARERISVREIRKRRTGVRVGEPELGGCAAVTEGLSAPGTWRRERIACRARRDDEEPDVVVLFATAIELSAVGRHDHAWAKRVVHGGTVPQP